MRDAAAKEETIDAAESFDLSKPAVIMAGGEDTEFCEVDGDLGVSKSSGQIKVKIEEEKLPTNEFHLNLSPSERSRTRLLKTTDSLQPRTKSSSKKPDLPSIKERTKSRLENNTENGSAGEKFISVAISSKSQCDTSLTSRLRKRKLKSLDKTIERLERAAKPNSRSKMVRSQKVPVMNAIPEEPEDEETEEDAYRDDCIEGGRCDGNKYDVERILDVQDRYVKVRTFLVKWKNYPLSEATYEPVHHFRETGGMQMVNEYLRKRSEKARCELEEITRRCSDE